MYFFHLVEIFVFVRSCVSGDFQDRPQSRATCRINEVKKAQNTSILPNPTTYNTCSAFTKEKQFADEKKGSAGMIFLNRDKMRDQSRDQTFIQLLFGDILCAHCNFVLANSLL